MSDNWEREKRRLELEAMEPKELAAAFESHFGEGTSPAKKDTTLTIKTILDDEFPQGVERSTTTSAPCSRCNKVTPHKTSVVKRDQEGKYETLQCSICDTWNKIPTGEHGESFQENLDTPDNTDFSEA